MHVDAVAADVIGAVLDRVDLAGDWVFVDADIVAQAPAEEEAIRVEVIYASTVEKIKSLDLTVPGRNVLGKRIDIGSAAAGDDHGTVCESWEQQCTSRVIFGGHVGNDNRTVVRNARRARAVRVGGDGFGG